MQPKLLPNEKYIGYIGNGNDANVCNCNSHPLTVVGQTQL